MPLMCERDKKPRTFKTDKLVTVHTYFCNECQALGRAVNRPAKVAHPKESTCFHLNAF